MEEKWENGGIKQSKNKTKVPELVRDTHVSNTSLILSAVIEKIVELKDLPAEVVERAVFENTIRLFSLPTTK